MHLQFSFQRCCKTSGLGQVKCSAFGLSKRDEKYCWRMRAPILFRSYSKSRVWNWFYRSSQAFQLPWTTKLAIPQDDTHIPAWELSPDRENRVSLHASHSPTLLIYILLTHVKSFCVTYVPRFQILRKEMIVSGNKNLINSWSQASHHPQMRTWVGVIQYSGFREMEPCLS